MIFRWCQLLTIFFTNEHLHHQSAANFCTVFKSSVSCATSVRADNDANTHDHALVRWQILERRLGRMYHGDVSARMRRACATDPLNQLNCAHRITVATVDDDAEVLRAASREVRCVGLEEETQRRLVGEGEVAQVAVLPGKRTQNLLGPAPR